MRSGSRPDLDGVAVFHTVRISIIGTNDAPIITGWQDDENIARDVATHVFQVTEASSGTPGSVRGTVIFDDQDGDHNAQAANKNAQFDFLVANATRLGDDANNDGNPDLIDHDPAIANFFLNVGRYIYVAGHYGYLQIDQETGQFTYFTADVANAPRGVTSAMVARLNALDSARA